MQKKMIDRDEVIIMREAWKVFRFPLLIGLVFGVIGYFLLITYVKPHGGAVGASVLFGFWMLSVIIGVRIMSNVITKMEQGNRLWFPLIGLIKLISTVAISFIFAPIFFVIQLVTLIFQLWKANKEGTIH